MIEDIYKMYRLQIEHNFSYYATYKYLLSFAFEILYFYIKLEIDFNKSQSQISYRQFQLRRKRYIKI